MTARSASTEPPIAAVEAAIGWMVRLHSGTATPQEHQACQHWQHERPENAQAWAAIAGFSQQMKALPSALAHSTLVAPHRPQRRTALKSVLLLGGAVGLGLAASPEGGWLAIASDHRTGVGERRRLALADGSTLHLNTATALEVRLDARQCSVALHAGEVLVECSPDHGTSVPRPFLVHTADGVVRTRDGRLLVRKLAGQTCVQALTASLDVHPLAPGNKRLATRRLEPGQQWVFDAHGDGPVGSVDVGADAWTDGLLVARDMRLAALVAELARYRRGWLRCEHAIAELRISGVFPVDDLQRVVAALQRTLPIRAREVTPWWVTLGPR